MHELQQETVTEAIKSVPPVLFTLAWFKGMTISDAVALVTLVYLLAQIGLLVPRYVSWYRGWRHDKRKR